MSLFFFIWQSLFFTKVISLPHDFVWGAGTAAFQVEGAWNLHGKGESIWDYFTTFKNTIYDNQNAQTTNDFYHKYLDDIKILSSLGIKNLRVSISWTRVLPTGDILYPSQSGIKFYKDLFTRLLQAGIEPWVTIYHWDLPQAYNHFSDTSTWLDPGIVYKYNDYADFCFKTFGDKIKKWVTFNEVYLLSWNGYGSGIFPPGRCSPDVNSLCETIGGGGNSGTEPYKVVHNILIAHGLAVRNYKANYQKKDQGTIGMIMTSQSALPFNASEPNDFIAANYTMAFQFGWIVDPLVFGRYPIEMSSMITDNRLPSFNSSMSKLIKGSFDFLGLNYYYSNYAQWTGIPGNNWASDGRVVTSAYNATGHLIGPFAEATWLTAYAPGLRLILNWIKDRYNNPEMYITENGICVPGEAESTLAQILNDTVRQDFINDHVQQIILAYDEDNVNIKGYFVWSFMDSFEWIGGYQDKFGLVYVNFTDLTRTIKNSGHFYANLIKQYGNGTVLSVVLGFYLLFS